MKRDLLLAEVSRTPWAIDPGYGERVLAVLHRWSRGEAASDQDMREVKAARDQRGARQAVSAGKGAIAVLPLHGVIAPKANLVTDISGGTSCQAFAAMLREAIADDTVSQILIDIDSPGGSVAGVQELASEIMQARTQKPIVGIAHHLAASAAYWLGACCTELYATPSGEVGSIGVYVAHSDESEALQKQGRKVTFVSAGKHKTEGNSAEPLSASAREHMQGQVNAYYVAFVAAVARGRGVTVDRVKTGFGQGRVLLAEAAKAEGMIDGVLTIEQLVCDMQSKPRSTRTTRPAALTSTGPMSAQARRNLVTLLSL